jgi:RNA polymerase sigma-54 factor
MNSLAMRADRRQTQTLSPRLQHAVRLLQMSSLDFAALVREKLGMNPFLEGDEGDDTHRLDGSPNHRDDADGGGPFDADGGGPFGSAPAAESMLDDGFVGEPPPHAPAGQGDGDDGGSDNDTDGDSGADRDLWSADGPGGLRGGTDGGGEPSALDAMSAPTTLAEHLRAQLSLLPLSPRELGLALVVCESLDDDGYLRTPLDELLPLLELEPKVAAAELELALTRVQALEPAGVGARSVAECLQLQLPAIESDDDRALAATIVTEQLKALAARDVSALAARLRQSPARIERVCERIRRLDPRPGWRHGASQTAYVVPDVVVKRVQGHWQVQLNPAVVPRVRLNEVYAELFARHRQAQHGELAEHLQDAKWTLRNVEQRFCTILDVANAIVRRQRHFLEFGAMAMKPLGLREIADEVGVHESTVSRVTNNKFMATPLGVFELKYFFSRAMHSANGSECSGTAIRSLVKDIIDAEPPAAPLSDVAITRALSQQGLAVARRTVTKYRQMLKVESVDRRRRCAG